MESDKRYSLFIIHYLII